MTWNVVETGPRELRCTFEGHLTELEGRESSARVARLLTVAPRTIVLNVVGMQGYDTGARRAWQDALLPVRRQITGLLLVGGNTFVRMGAAALGVALGIPVGQQVPGHPTT